MTRRISSVAQADELMASALKMVSAVFPGGRSPSYSPCVKRAASRAGSPTARMAAWTAPMS